MKSLIKLKGYGVRGICLEWLQWCLNDRIQWVSGYRSKERDRKSEIVLGSTYQIFEWDRNNSDRNFDFWGTNRIAADRIF